jgi:preprotein translocase subunit SecE
VNNDNIDDNPKSTESKRQLNQLAIRPKSLEKIQRFIHLKDEKLSDPEIAQVLILVHEISPLDARLIIEETLGRPFKQDEPLAKQEEAPTQKPKRMKTFRVVLEIVYVAVLGFLFDTIIWNIEVPYQKYRGDDVRTEIADIGWSNGQNLMISIIGLMALILIFEWVRRKKLKGNRPAFEKYFYIPAIFMIFLLGLLVGRFLLISYKA